MANRGFLGTATLTMAVVLAAAVAALFFLWAGSETAQAAFPGKNGKIVYASENVLGWDLDFPETDDTDVWVVNPDGGGQRNLTDTPEDEYNPAFSPGGGKIAFSRGGGVWVMDSDGSGQRRLADGGDPAWSPDGTRIAFGYEGDVWVTDADGTARQRLTDAPEDPDTGAEGADKDYAWSPDGTEIVFVRDYPYTDTAATHNTDVWVVNPDGGGQRNLTDTPGVLETGPAFSPGGGKIAFARCYPKNYYCFDYDFDVWAMDADGSGQENLTDRFDAKEVDPDGPEGPRRIELSEEEPTWSPDGLNIAFGVSTECHSDIYEIDASGSAWRNLTKNENTACDDLPYHAGGPAYSPDGEKVLYEWAEGYDYADIGVANRDGSGNTFPANGYTFDSQPDWQAFADAPPVPADTTDPTITRPRPGSTIRDRTPTISAVVRDNKGLAKADVDLYVDGRARGFSYDPKSGRLSRTTGTLSYGRHTAKVVAEDGSGNRVARAWSFRVVRRG